MRHIFTFTQQQQQQPVVGSPVVHVVGEAGNDEAERGDRAQPRPPARGQQATEHHLNKII